MPQRRVQELNITPQMRFISYTNLKRSLKIPQAQSEFVYRRRTDNTMVKRKRKKGQPTIYKTYIYKTKDRVTRTPLKTGFELRCSGRTSGYCSTSTFLFLCWWCRNVATYRWKEDNGKFKVASFVTKCYSLLALMSGATAWIVIN